MPNTVYSSVQARIDVNVERKTKHAPFVAAAVAAVKCKRSIDRMEKVDCAHCTAHVHIVHAAACCCNAILIPYR